MTSLKSEQIKAVFIIRANVDVVVVCAARLQQRRPH